MTHTLVLDRGERESLEQSGELTFDKNGDEILIGLSRLESVEFLRLQRESFIHTLSIAKRRKYGLLKSKRKAATEIGAVA
ncbi:hypothetical protein [Microbaculum marinum]|uniref:Transposase n=1 Tax=Microbaculum marinum TaxID=1764581 RepID=A0AAW9RYH3_9HYPH